MLIESKKTKIVATLGPVCEHEEGIRNLIEAGVSMFRLNTSHGTEEDHRRRIEIIRRVCKEKNIHLPVLVDLQGPKIRIGNLESEMVITNGQKLVFSPSVKEKDIIPVDYAGLANDVKPGDMMLIDDGKLEVVVEKVEDDKVYTEVVNGGVLKSRKGLNIPGSTASLAAVTPRDVKFIEFAVNNNADYVALSFVRQKEDILTARDYIKNFGGDIPIIAKIEKPQAVDNMKEIIQVSDGVMVARGDLGIEISPEKVPIVQKRIINEALQQRKVTIVATQMLETMIEQPIPTRAEASDVANAIIDGTDAIMLSGETSVGKFYAEAVHMMTMIAENVEHSDFCRYDLDLPINPCYHMTRQAVVNAAVKMVKDIDAKAILAFTHTGYTPKLMSKLRPKVPIIVISDSEATCRRLNLFWDMFPFCRNWDRVLNREFLIELDEFLLSNTDLKADDRVILTGSIPKLITGKTNFIRVHRIGATSVEDV